MSQITLSAAMRSNLLSLQNTQKLMDSTQGKLATGLKVNSPLDNPSNFFAASGMRLRANDLTDLKDAMGNAVQVIKASEAAVKGIESLLKTARGLIESARTAASGDRADLQIRYNEVLNQINELARDSDFQGINLVGSLGTGATLDVLFDNRVGRSSSSKLTVVGFNATTTALGSSGVMSAADWDTTSGVDLNAVLNSLAASISRAMSYLQAKSAGLAANLAIISTRLDYSSNMSNVLKEGADKLTLADTNEEGANMLALQTRQQLGITSLSLASQSNQSVLRLF